MNDFPSPSEVEYRVEDPVALVTLNRPRKLNAWTPRMGDEIDACYVPPTILESWASSSLGRVEHFAPELT